MVVQLSITETVRK